MRWIAQVLLVARKDIRYVARFLPLYAATLAVVTAVAVGWPHLQRTTTNSNWSLLVVMVTVFLFATVVQQDSPSRADTFVATQPLSWSALVAAKVVTAFVTLFAPALVVQAVVLAAYSMPTRDFPPLLAASFGVSGEILLFAMLAAALTPDLRAFLVVLLVGIVALTASSFVPAGLVDISGRTDDILLDLPLLAYAVLILYQYATRDTARTRLAGLMATTAGIGFMSNAVSVTTHTFDRPDSTSRSTLSIAGTDTAWRHSNGSRPLSDTVWLTGVRVATDRARPRVSLQFVASVARPGDRMEFLPSTAGLYLEHADHRHEALPDERSRTALNNPAPPVPASVRLLDVALRSDSAKLEVPVTRTQAVALLSGEATLHVDGSLATNRAHPFATLPIRGGGRGVAPQTRLEIDSVVDGTATVWMHIAAIERPESKIPLTSFPRDSIDFVAIRDAAHEAIPLDAHQISTGLLSAPMLGPAGHTTQLTLTPSVISGDSGSLPRATRLRDARLAIVRWTLVRIDEVAFVVPPSMVDTDRRASLTRRRDRR